MRYYIYIVRCADGSHYTGIAAHLCRRMREHVEKLPGCARYTRAHPVVALDGLWQAEGRQKAARLEYAIKRLGKQEKLRLMAQPECLAQVLPQLAAEDYCPVPHVTLEMCLKGEVNHGD